MEKLYKPDAINRKALFLLTTMQCANLFAPKLITTNQLKLH